MSVEKSDGVAPERRGLSNFLAVCFVAGETAGVGMLALPYALNDIGWVGLVLLVLFWVNTCFCGRWLAECWLVVEERCPEASKHLRAPYSFVGETACGKRMR